MSDPAHPTSPSVSNQQTLCCYDPVWDGNTAWTLCFIPPLFLWESFIVYEKENQKDSVGSWKCDPGYDIDGLRYSDRMWRFLLSHLWEDKQNISVLIYLWTCENVLHFTSLYMISLGVHFILKSLSCCNINCHKFFSCKSQHNNENSGSW